MVLSYSTAFAPSLGTLRREFSGSPDLKFSTASSLTSQIRGRWFIGRGRKLTVPINMGPPGKIDYAKGRIVSNQEIARASFLLRIESDAAHNYEPGHVFALSVKDPKDENSELVHPYTVSRSDRAKNTFDILFR